MTFAARGSFVRMAVRALAVATWLRALRSWLRSARPRGWSLDVELIAVALAGLMWTLLILWNVVDFVRFWMMLR